MDGLRKQNWRAFAGGGRFQTIAALEEVISNGGGHILDINSFSDLMLSIRIEIAEKQIAGLHKALQRVIRISELAEEKIDSYSEQEWLIFLTVSFARGAGNLRREVPAVPG